MMAGTRERIVVLEVGGEQHLIGVTAQNINHLSKLEHKLESTSHTPAENFKDKLTQALAGKMTAALDKQHMSKNAGVQNND